ncbi:MAG: AAA family ATPase [Myxococcaceae bacterium]
MIGRDSNDADGCSVLPCAVPLLESIPCAQRRLAADAYEGLLRVQERSLNALELGMRGQGTSEELARAIGEADALTAIAAGNGPVTMDARTLLQLDLPSPSWLLRAGAGLEAPGLVLRDSVTILGGPPGVGKTMLAMMLAFEHALEGGRVLFVEAEGSWHGIRQRLKAIFGGRSPSGSLVVQHPGPDLCTASGIEQLAEGIEARRPTLLVLDSLAALAPGLDENEASNMGRLAGAIGRLRRQGGGTTMLCLHHTPKEKWDGGKKPTLSDLRGHGALAGSADGVLMMSALGRGGPELRFTLHTVKQRDSARPEPVNGLIEMGLSTGNLLTWDLTPARGAAVSATSPSAEVEQRVLDQLVRGDVVGADRLARELRLGAALVREAVKRLIVKGLVLQNRRGVRLTGSAGSSSSSRVRPNELDEPGASGPPGSVRSPRPLGRGEPNEPEAGNASSGAEQSSPGHQAAERAGP